MSLSNNAVATKPSSSSKSPVPEASKHRNSSNTSYLSSFFGFGSSSSSSNPNSTNATTTTTNNPAASKFTVSKKKSQTDQHQPRLSRSFTGLLSSSFNSSNNNISIPKKTSISNLMSAQAVPNNTTTVTTTAESTTSTSGQPLITTQHQQQQQPIINDDVFSDSESISAAASPQAQGLNLVSPIVRNTFEDNDNDNFHDAINHSEDDELMIIDDDEDETAGNTVSPPLIDNTISKRNKNGTYSIRLTPHVDSGSNVNSTLYFGSVVRKLSPGSTIAIGRYTEKNKEALTASPNSSSPVVFKSKVVSRTHGEITVDEEGNWFIKDLKSSSGTFLNHKRLSQANQESERFRIKEGDLLQLGMDFRGGTEEIYRCVKMRVELNKSWIRRTKQFSKEAHERIKNLAPQTHGNDIQCVICLEDIKPCQAVFVSPCSHSYHYKCIVRVILKTYPQFLCPTCRALSDLEAEDEDDSDSD